MGRKYRVIFPVITISAAQDLIQVKGATGKSLRILEQAIFLAQESLPTAQGWKLRSQILPATVTDGTGGAAATPAKTDPGDVAATATALRNSTGVATSSGTAITVHEAGGHVYQGHLYRYPEQEAPVVGPTSSFTFGMISTPTTGIAFSGYVIFEEIG
jgi:hypothetical protein